MLYTYCGIDGYWYIKNNGYILPNTMYPFVSTNQRNKFRTKKACIAFINNLEAQNNESR
jgi:hypothetical protein